MKQAEHCGCSSTPTLNQTGELKATFWRSSRWVSSAWKACRVGLGGEVAALARPSAVMVSTTRRDQLAHRRVSRSGVPGVPRKYLEATTLVASIDQDFGTSMSFCSKTTLPSSPVMPAVRSSQAISSAGSTPGVVK